MASNWSIKHQGAETVRQLEHKAKKSRLEVHRQMFAEQCQTVVKLINQRKSEYYHSKLKDADCS